MSNVTLGNSAGLRSISGPTLTVSLDIWLLHTIMFYAAIHSVYMGGGRPFNIINKHWIFYCDAPYKTSVLPPSPSTKGPIMEQIERKLQINEYFSASWVQYRLLRGRRTAFKSAKNQNRLPYMCKVSMKHIIINLTYKLAALAGWPPDHQTISDRKLYGFYFHFHTWNIIRNITQDQRNKMENYTESARVNI